MIDSTGFRTEFRILNSLDIIFFSLMVNSDRKLGKKMNLAQQWFFCNSSRSNYFYVVQKR